MMEKLADYEDGKLVASWKHGDKVDEAVFRIAATFPLQYLERKRYEIPGDYLWKFDGNAFIQRLIEETRITHTWKPIRIRLADGDRTLSMIEQPGPPRPQGSAELGCYGRSGKCARVTSCLTSAGSIPRCSQGFIPIF